MIPSFRQKWLIFERTVSGELSPYTYLLRNLNKHSTQQKQRTGSWKFWRMTTEHCIKEIHLLMVVRDLEQPSLTTLTACLNTLSPSLPVSRTQTSSLTSLTPGTIYSLRVSTYIPLDKNSMYHLWPWALWLIFRLPPLNAPDLYPHSHRLLQLQWSPYLQPCLYWPYRWEFWKSGTPVFCILS